MENMRIKYSKGINIRVELFIASTDHETFV